MSATNPWFRIDFSPLIDGQVWLVLSLLTGLALIVHLICARRARMLRIALAVLLVLALLNPSWIRELREERPDIVALVLDRSESMNIGDRKALSERAFEIMQTRLQANPGLDIRVIETRTDTDSTQLFSALRAGLADTPRERIGGTILITDGQVHDVPETLEDAEAFGPIHALVTGQNDVPDRRIEILAAPSFGVVGEDTEITVIVHDPTASTANIRLSINGQPLPPTTVKTGVSAQLKLSLPRRGTNLVLMEIDEKIGEPTILNNRAAKHISGIRDRLRVLLVTGQPHAGERVWRDLLKSDPAVDLVHFTILRPTYKANAIPTHELALIAFPTRELFVQRLPEFDLVILDQYKRRNVLSMTYFDNISQYVADGGALLVTAGTSFAGPASIYRTSLASVLPTRPTGAIINKTIKPQRSALGKRHTITGPLPPDSDWGPWRRHIDSIRASGDTLIETADRAPLLVLDRVGEGRVAMLMSDQLWLWARGHEGGGPYGELIRRLAHWLMREPELEEESLELTSTEDGMSAFLRSLGDQPPDLQITSPNGQSFSLPWQEEKSGQWRAETLSETLGIWQANAGDLQAIALKGPSNPREYQDVQAVADYIAPVIEAGGGGVFALETDADIAKLPQIKRIGKRTKNAVGRNWIGIKRNHSYVVRDLQSHRLIPSIVAALLALILMMLLWWREGH